MPAPTGQKADQLSFFSQPPYGVDLSRSGDLRFWITLCFSSVDVSGFFFGDKQRWTLINVPSLFFFLDYLGHVTRSVTLPWCLGL